MSHHRRHKGPRLQRDPNHASEPQLATTTYAAADLPARVDLRPHLPPVVDQGETESCTANALAGAYGYLEGRIAGKQTAVSRLFIYYNERALEDSVAEDEGAVIADGIKVLKRYGACEERTWPFHPDRLEDKPHAKAYAEGKGHEIDQAATVAVDLHAMRHCLAEGYPFVFGLDIDDFEPDARGFLKRPTSKKDLGGHAMCCVGYDDTKKVFIIRNSWGPDWGDKGYGYVPYAWMTDEEACSDLWTLRRAHSLDFSMVDEDEETEDDDDDETEDDDDDDDETEDDDETDDDDDDDDEEDDDEDETEEDTAVEEAPAAKAPKKPKKKAT
jgi:C1A family cysteine protease